MIAVFWTKRSACSHRDYYEIIPEPERAAALIEKLKTEDGILCWGSAPVTQASEPHWVDG